MGNASFAMSGSPSRWPWPVHAVYINLSHRVDRRQEIENEAAKMGVFMHRLEASRHTKGFMGCTASHIRALQQCLVRLRDGFALVFEDDFVCTARTNAWKERVTQFWDTHPEANVLMLSSNPYTMSLPEDGVAKVQWALTSSGYMVRYRYVPTLIANLQQALIRHRPLDVHWHQLQKDGTWYACRPAVGKQRPSYSDIELRHTNYGV